MSELGDKTFFIAAILAMRNNKLTVFLAAIAALGVMTVLSVSLYSDLASYWSMRVIIASDWMSHWVSLHQALLGFVVTTFIPREYTYYACTAIMALFGESPGGTWVYNWILETLKLFKRVSFLGLTFKILESWELRESWEWKSWEWESQDRAKTKLSESWERPDRD